MSRERKRVVALGLAWGLPYLLLLIAVVVLAASTAWAQMAPVPERCDERAKLLRWLEAENDETAAALGITERGSLIELFTSARGSWTVLATAPGRPRTCIVASGRSWQAVAGAKGQPTTAQEESHADADPR